MRAFSSALLWLALALALSPRGLMAQAPPDAEPLAYNQPVSGEIDAAAPSRRYQFDGLRGEFVTLQLEVTAGALDPILILAGPDGAPLFMRDDSLGQTGALTSQLQLPANGPYTVVVARFGQALGSTQGEYTLTVSRSGASSDSGSALRYGDTVVNTISDSQPEVYYTFRAQRGDLITLTMLRNSGNLDPYLRIVSAARAILAENDDSDGVNTARIADFPVEEDGQYLIIATRYGFAGGTSTGSFFLTLERSSDSGAGNSPQVAIRLLPGQPVEGEITADRNQLYYTFEARADEVITLRMNRLSGTLDPLLDLADSELRVLVSNDDIEAGVNRDALIGQFRIPADGRYYVIATRYERAAGATLGRFSLGLTSSRGAFDSLSGATRLTYGASATGVLDAASPTALYAFYGVEGEAITAVASATGGDLAPALALLDDTQAELTVGAQEAATGLAPAAARIDRYALPRTGLYFLRVGATGGAGSFLLILTQRFD